MEEMEEMEVVDADDDVATAVASDFLSATVRAAVWLVEPLLVPPFVEAAFAVATAVIWRSNLIMESLWW